MLDTLDSLSWPGSPERANEDAFGAAGRWAWVIDASIVPGTAPVLHPSSDAAWFAAFASARFAALAPAASAGPALARQVMAEARAVFLAGASARRDPLLWPVAALTLVRADAGFGRWPTRRPMSAPATAPSPVSDWPRHCGSARALRLADCFKRQV